MIHRDMKSDMIRMEDKWEKMDDKWERLFNLMDNKWEKMDDKWERLFSLFVQDKIDDAANKGKK